MRTTRLLRAACALAIIGSALNCRLYFNNMNVNIPDNAEEYGVSEIEVLKRRPVLINDLDVEISIQHPDLSELEAWIESPQGTVVPLFSEIDGEGLRSLVFDDDGENLRPVSAWGPPAGYGPWGGTVQIQDYERRVMGLFLFDGEDPNGVWRLCVRDRVPGNTGSITFFGLGINGEW